MKRILAMLVVFVLLSVPVAGISGGSGWDYDYKVLDDGTAMITGYRGSDADPVFPETIDGRAVSRLSGTFSARTVSIASIRSVTVPNTMTTIEPGALQFAEYLTEIRIAGDHPALAFEDGVLYNRNEQSIVLYLQTNTAEHFEIPEGIRVIGDRAFYRSRLVSVCFPGSVERIGRDSFNQCIRLSDVSLAEGLRSIGTDAFTNCDRLKSIDIPASVSEIGEAAFTDAHLKAIRVAPDNPVFAVSGGALINIRDGVLIAYPPMADAETCVIPEDVTRIGAFAFYRSHNLKKVVFPDGLLEIGSKAFLSCNHLMAIDLPDSVILLEKSAFGDNSDVETLHLPAGLTEIIDNFDDMNITELEIPETVISIKDSFSSLRSLAEVVLPGSVSTVSGKSFTFCRKLASITIPAGVTEISSTFTGCGAALVIRVEPGSFAEQYCGDHQLTFEYISE